MNQDAFRILHGRRGSLGDIVRQVDQELGQAALCGGVVAEDRGECSVSKWLGQALSECLAGSAVVAQTVHQVRDDRKRVMQKEILTEGNSAQRA